MTDKIEIGPISDTVRMPVAIIAKRLGVTQKTILNMIDDGMPARRIGNRIWVLAGHVIERFESVDAK